MLSKSTCLCFRFGTKLLDRLSQDLLCCIPRKSGINITHPPFSTETRLQRKVIRVWETINLNNDPSIKPLSCNYKCAL